MPNGKPGDHPINDIVDHGLEVFSREADELVRELARLVPRDRMWGLMDWLSPPRLPELTQELHRLVEMFRDDARGRGWDV